MAKPEVDIQVDEATGRWSVDALPMILRALLRHHKCEPKPRQQKRVVR